MRLRKVSTYVQKNDAILDFGCGHQAYLLHFVKDIISMGVGIDYDVQSEKVAQNIEIKQFYFKNKLPFIDKKFNKVFMLASIEHLEIATVPYLFQEFNRILKPNGKVILTTPTPFGKVILEFLAFKLRVISQEEVGDHKKYYNKQDLENISNNAGFRTETYQTFQLGGNSLCVLKKS